jgi:hypothetical protein
MKIITVDGKSFDVKYLQNKEDITSEFGTGSFNYPNFVGSKVVQNSTSSDIYSLTFAIHKSLFVGFKESIKKFISNPDDAIDDPTYGKLTDIIIEHATWGAIKGKFTDRLKYDTSKDGDIVCSGTFQENTEDNPTAKKDIEQQNQEACDDIDDETDFDEDLDANDKSALGKFADQLNSIYSNIQNSAVVSALNDLNHEMNQAMLDAQKVMNATKKILALPNSIFSNFNQKLDFFNKQSEAIKGIPVHSMNMAKFNIKCLSYNIRQASRIPFFNKELLRSKAGLRVAPLK